MYSTLLPLSVQESLFSTTDHLAVTLQPLLTGLSNQLALQSSLLSQSIAGIRTQVSSASQTAHKMIVHVHVCCDVLSV